jgi:oxygen-dependent protoporphyrinogen oxidase
LVQAMIGGVYAGDAQQLEVASALPILTQFEGEQGSVLRGIRARRQAKKSSAGPSSAQQVFSFRDGIEGLVNRLAAAAPGQVELDAAVDSVAYDGGVWTAKMRDGSERRAPRLIMACPARVSARLLAAVAPALSAELAEIPFASLASVYLGMPMTTLPSKLSGFGFLLETEPGNPVLGAIYASQLFPDHAPPGHQLVRVMMGGSLHPSAVDCEDTDLIDSAAAAMRRYVGLDVAPTFTHVVRARQAIPQFELGHKQRMHRITDMLGQFPGLRLCGNSYQNVALTAQLSRRAGLQSSATNCSEEVAR